MVVWIVPVYRFPIQRSDLLQQRHKAYAIAVLFRLEEQAGHFQDSWIEVCADDRPTADGAGLNIQAKYQKNLIVMTFTKSTAAFDYSDIVCTIKIFA